LSDPSVVCNFPLKDEEGTFFVAWTTTPWTLPSNLALCVNPALEYVKIKEKASGKVYILMASRLVQIYPELGNPKKKKDALAKFEELERFPGKKLEGTQYVPPFDYFERTRATGSFRVITGDFVTEDAGTGIVHCAPAFGEEDYKACIAHHKDTQAAWPRGARQ
jgi:isoleucyl-tRNA synthetase